MKSNILSLPDRIVRDVIAGKLGNPRGEVTPQDIVKRYGRTKLAKSYLTTVLKNGERSVAERDSGRPFVARVKKGVYVITKEAKEKFLAQR